MDPRFTVVYPLVKMFKVTSKTRSRFKIDKPKIVGIKDNGIPRVSGDLRRLRSYDPEIDRRRTDDKDPIYRSRVAVGLNTAADKSEASKAVYGLRIGRPWHIKIEHNGGLWLHIDPAATSVECRIPSASVKLGMARDGRFRRNTRIPSFDLEMFGYWCFGGSAATSVNKLWKAAEAAAEAHSPVGIDTAEAAAEAEAKAAEARRINRDRLVAKAEAKADQAAAEAEARRRRLARLGVKLR